MKHRTAVLPRVTAILLCAWVLLSCTTAWSAEQTKEIPPAEAKAVRVVVWDEQQPAQKPTYDNFLGNAIADHLKARPGFKVTSVHLDDPEEGLPDSVLTNATCSSGGATCAIAR